MWQRTAWIIAIGLQMSWLSDSFAEDRAEPDQLISDYRWVRFEIVGGRIQATHLRVGQHRHQVSKEHPAGELESLAVAFDGGVLSLRYTRQSDDEYLCIVAGREDRFEFCWRRETTEGKCCETRFVQPPHSPLVLSIDQPNEPLQEYRVPGIWHLAILHPDICQLHVVPILDRLCLDHPLRLEVDEVRDELFQTALLSPSVCRREVQRLVNQLGASSFQTRRRAASQLQAMGPCVISFLDELSASRLDREQRHRLDDLKKCLVPRTADTPARCPMAIHRQRRLDRVEWRSRPAPARTGRHMRGTPCRDIGGGRSSRDGQHEPNWQQCCRRRRDRATLDADYSRSSSRRGVSRGRYPTCGSTAARS